MLSQLTTIMYSEHAIILEAGQIVLSDELAKLPDEQFQKKIESLLNFFSNYADRYHHFKEEELLFPALEKTSDPAIGAIVTEMNEQHESFRDLINEIRTDLASNKRETVIKNLKIYIYDLSDHIAVENEELFPMADALLSTDELEKLYYRCIDEDNRLGIERKEELEKLIKNINQEIDEPSR